MRAEIALAAAALLAGCSTVCKGPGCAAEYGASRLVVLGWSGTTLDPWDDAEVVIRGAETDGVGWRLFPGPSGTVWIGMPDANRVVRVSVDASGPVDPLFEVSAEGGAFGSAVATADVDGDGVRDLLVGAPEDDLGAGAVYVFLGLGAAVTGQVAASQADVVVAGTSPSDRLGTRIVPCADLTGDGIGEVAITAPWLQHPGGAGTLDTGTAGAIPDLAGGVFLARSEAWSRRGRLDPWEIATAWWGAAEGDGFGAAIACRDDLSGDREPDVAIGAPYAGDGAVYVVFVDGAAKDAGLPTLPGDGPLDEAEVAAVLRPDTPNAWFGAALAAGELDGLPPNDLAVGAPGAHEGRGQVAVFQGTSLDAPGALAWRLALDATDRASTDHVGRRLAVADLSGDDRDDLLVGAPDFYGDGNNYDAGALFGWTRTAVQLTPTFTTASAEWEVRGTQPFQRVGEAFLVLPATDAQPPRAVLATRARPPTSP